MSNHDGSRRRLSCILELESILEDQNLTQDEIFERSVEILPLSMQYPEIACSRIVFEEDLFLSGNFVESRWKLQSDIQLGDTRSGSVEIFYNLEKPKRDEGPFLESERAILDSISTRLGNEIERRRKEESLRIYKCIIDSARESMSFIDKNYRYRALNNAFRIASGPAEEIVGETVRKVFGDDVFENVIKPHLDRCLTGEDVNYQDWFERPGFGERFIDVFYYPFMDQWGSVVGVVALAHDITESKKLEDERKHLLDQVELKNQELEQVIYAASHDLRSPMTNIQGFTNELSYSIDDLKEHLEGSDIDEGDRKRVLKILEEEMPQSMSYIKISISKMDMLLSGLLRLSRLGRAKMESVDLDMNELIRDVVRVLETRAKEKGAVIDVDHLPNCVGDRTQIDQVFSNIIENGLKYLDPSRPGKIHVTGRRETDRVVYCIEDNGIGIEEKDLKKIFHLFSRIDPQDSNGEGLGLTIVRKIIYRHKGEISVESTPGVGSIFYISLPIVNELEEGAY